MGVGDELVKLSEFLKDPDNRAAFSGHGHARPAMTAAGIDWSEFPPNFVDTLEKVLPDDMGIVSGVNVNLRRLTAADKSKIVQFPV